MSNIKRTLITVLAMILVCVISVSATLAYLYDKSESVVNTFSVGNVEISLDEADVDNDSNTADNVTINGQIRDLANEMMIQLKRTDKSMFEGFGPSCYTYGACPEGRMCCGKQQEMKKMFDEME